MKQILVLAALLIANCSFSQLEEMPIFSSNPGNLSCYSHRSQLKNQDTLPALVVVLHGCSQTASSIAKDAGWNELSDRFGFHVIYPEQSIKNNMSRCFNWFNSSDNQLNDGESYSIYQFTQQAIDSFHCDPKRVFIYGVSAGGAMCVNSLVLYPFLFKAGASLAGGPFGIATTPLEALTNMQKPPVESIETWDSIARSVYSNKIEDYPSLIIIQGTKDAVVDYRVSIELCKQWCGLTQADSKAGIINQQFQDNSKVSRTVYSNSLHEEKVIFYSLANWGHYLSIDPGTNFDQGGSKSFLARDGDFYSTYWILKDWGLIK